MRRKRTTPQEQLRLISECRQSGLTDYEWCQQHDIKTATFYAWVHRLKQSGEIEIPAVIPTVIHKEAEQPDIVKIEIEGERQSGPAGGCDLMSEEATESTSAMQRQPGYPVMEVLISDVHLRVTNDVNPGLLAETIRLLRSAGC